jgi:putative oxidoreductase
MSNYVSRYPDGAAGLALLFIRMSYAFVAFGIIAMPPTGILSATFLHLAAGLVALSLLAGLATRLIALLLGIAVATTLAAAGPIQQLLLAGHIGGCAAIVLIGPGAFSVDARRHGRRVILLQTNTPDRGANQ